MEIEFKPFTELLKKHMKNKKLSQQSLADLCENITRSYIGDALRQVKPLSRKALAEIITVLKLTEEEKRELWESWMYERGDKETMIYLKEIEKKYSMLISKKPKI